MENYRFYMKNSESFEKRFNTDFRLNNSLDINEVENGVILPLKECRDSNNPYIVFYSGGALDSEYNFVSGLKREYKNLSCCSGYVPDEEPAFRDEEVVFGGILFNHFGHMLTDSMSRFWYFARNPKLPYKIVFLCGGKEEFKYTRLLDLMDISPDRYEIIKKPTRFKKIYIPEQALIMGKGYADCWLECFDFIREKAEPSSKKKIFLSRLHFLKDSVNEIYYTEFFKKRGFEIIFPEELPLEEQISILGGAEEVVAISGTLVHLCQFCRPGTKLTILLRTSDLIDSVNYSVKVRGLKCSYVEAHINFLPTTHAFGGIYLFGPTEYFKKYLQDSKIEFSDEELELGEQKEKIIYDYIKMWAQKYSKPVNYKKINGADIFGVLEEMGAKLFNIPISSNEFDVTKKEVLTETIIEVGKMLEKLSGENKRLTNENKMLKNICAELKQMKNNS